MTKPLITLEEHNKQKLTIYETQGNGIACPNCGSELFDVNNMMALASYPPQFAVFCRKCKYQGTRY